LAEFGYFFSYGQQSGELAFHTDDGVKIMGHGWAGNHAGKNNPDMQAVHSTGPLPEGSYTIGTAQSHPRLGPVCMYLDPAEDNQMFGRSEFFIHGASREPASYGQESKGCIVLPRPVREFISNSGIKKLMVINA